MAALNMDSLTCAICLELLQEPVSLPCGHSYCKNCILDHWNHQVKSDSCPQCRQNFSPRPVLSKNITIAALVEDLKKTGLTAPPADDGDVSPADMSCDACTGKKLKAFRSCLQCVASYCESHLKPHHETTGFQTHQLVEPSELQENVCFRHNKVKELFCRTDQQLLCSLCSEDQHKGHDMVSSATEKAHRLKQLPSQRILLQQSLKHMEKDLKKLRQEAQQINSFAKRAMQCSGNSFREMALLLEKRRVEVKQQIRSEQETQLKRVQDLQEKLEQGMTEMKSCISALDKLSFKSSHAKFLLHCPLLSADAQGTESTDAETKMSISWNEPSKNFENMSLAVEQLRERLCLSLTEFKLPEPEPRCRHDFLRFAHDVTLDMNSVSTQLAVSEGFRRATLIEEELRYPCHRERFTVYQVLSKQSLTGRCYFEVAWRGLGGVFIALTYSDIHRKDLWDLCSFGNNDKSWALDCVESGYSFHFNKVKSNLSGPVPGREGSIIGVYLDHEAGAVSFYIVQDETMTLLHRVQTHFTKPLYAGLGLGFVRNNSACFSKLKSDK